MTDRRLDKRSAIRQGFNRHFSYIEKSLFGGLMFQKV